MISGLELEGREPVEPVEPVEPSSFHELSPRPLVEEGEGRVGDGAVRVGEGAVRVGEGGVLSL